MSDCHFCNRPRQEAEIMLHGNGHRICGRCVRLCAKTMTQKGFRVSTRAYTPRTRKTEIHLPCPGCQTKLRISQLLPPLKHHCPVCEIVFLADKGARGRVILSLEEPEIQTISGVPQTRDEAWKELGLDAQTGADVAKKAYRQQCQLYHPDKVAALGPELRQLAEVKMKRLNAAYVLLQE